MAELTLEGLQKQIEDQATQIETLTKSNSDLLRIVSEKNTTIAAGEPAKKPQIPTETVTVDKKKYAFAVAAFHLPGEAEPNTAEQAITDPKLLAKIVAIKGQTILTEQV